MKIVIPFKDFNGPELKYCLRGVENYLPNPEITIIGDLPSWIKNINFIPFKDNPDNQWKERNIYQKVLLASDMFDKFLYMNDDHFLLSPNTMFKRYDYFDKNISDLKEGKDGQYLTTINNTFNIIGNCKNFDVHCPLYIYSKEFKSIGGDWDIPYGYCMKSLYCHKTINKPFEYSDLKFREPIKKQEILKQIEGRLWFSTGNKAINQDMIEVLESMYPEKSIYEN